MTDPADELARLAEGPPDKGAVAGISRALAKSARAAGAGAVASGRWAAETLIDLAPRIEHIGVGDGDDHLAGLEPVTAKDRRLRIGRATDDMRTAHDLARIIDCNDLDALTRHTLHKCLPVRWIWTEDLHALDRAHRTDRPATRQGLLPCAEEAQHRGIRAGDLGDRQRALVAPTRKPER